MKTFVTEYAAAHRTLLQAAARQAGIADPLAVDPGELQVPLLKAAQKGALLPLDGVLVRDWAPLSRGHEPGATLGLRLYQLGAIRFARVCFNVHFNRDSHGLDFLVVDRADYVRLYRKARRSALEAEPLSTPPVLPPEQLDVLWKNTIDYLEPANLRRIKRYGGRPKRGVLLLGPPGNGKTMACRWLWEECRRRCWEWRLVKPEAYQQARNSCSAVEAVRELFAVQRRGIVFFDDMDLALRDRETVRETDDQAVFLGALDGIQVHEGVVFVFTSNCALELIDRAFKRPGRLDLVLHFLPPEEDLRRQLVERWHDEIQAHLPLDVVVDSTEGYSFAEIEELKNLLIMHYMDTGAWDWEWALEQFDVNRHELEARRRRRVGFGPTAPPVPVTGNGR